MASLSAAYASVFHSLCERHRSRCRGQVGINTGAQASCFTCSRPLDRSLPSISMTMPVTVTHIAGDPTSRTACECRSPPICLLTRGITGAVLTKASQHGEHRQSVSNAGANGSALRHGIGLIMSRSSIHQSTSHYQHPTVQPSTSVIGEVILAKQFHRYHRLTQSQTRKSCMSCMAPTWPCWGDHRSSVSQARVLQRLKGLLPGAMPSYPGPAC